MSQKKTNPPFKFTLQKGSPVSPEQQLVANLKIAIMLGALKPGEKLPSVRQLETELGVGRNVIWRAYSKLAESGALTIENRRRATVNSHSRGEEAVELVKAFDWLARDVIERIRALRINPQSFQRLLNHRIQELDVASRDIVFVECNAIQAENWSSEISQAWGLPVQGMVIKSLHGVPAEERATFRTVLTPLYHYEDVSKLFLNPYTRTIPLRLKWDQGKIREWRALPEGSAIAFILEKSECLGYGDPLARELKTLCPNLRMQIIAFKSIPQVRKVLTSGMHICAFLSGPVLALVDEGIRKSPRVVTRALRVDTDSLKDAQIQAGVVL
jgi:DNA-binding transcriptional regulator YhcF (GntR family)